MSRLDRFYLLQNIKGIFKNSNQLIINIGAKVLHCYDQVTSFTLEGTVYAYRRNNNTRSIVSGTLSGNVLKYSF